VTAVIKNQGVGEQKIVQHEKQSIEMAQWYIEHGAKIYYPLFRHGSHDLGHHPLLRILLELSGLETYLQRVRTDAGGGIKSAYLLVLIFLEKSITFKILIFIEFVSLSINLFLDVDGLLNFRGCRLSCG
jgi:hypothetical protein